MPYFHCISSVSLCLWRKKCPVVKTGVGLENMECHADTQEGGFSVLIHTAAAARGCVEMRVNSNLRSAGKQIDKCSIRLQILHNLLHTNAPLCSLCVSQRPLLQLVFANLLFLPTQWEFHIQRLVEAYTANRLESLGIRSLKQVVCFSRSVKQLV